MGTKNKPGKFDCYENADPNEPMFILLGRDPSACHLVRLWAEIRKLEGEDPDKVIEALDCADAMERWADHLDKRPRILESERLLAGILLQLDRDTLRTAREDAIRDACDWVRAHGPLIPNAGQMRQDLLKAIDPNKDEGRDDAKYYQGLERELEQLEKEDPEVRKTAKNLEKMTRRIVDQRCAIGREVRRRMDEANDGAVADALADLDRWIAELPQRQRGTDD